MFLRMILFILLLTVATPTMALDYYSFLYKVEVGDSFSLILKKFVYDNSIINAKTPLVKKTREYNPHVKDWNRLHPGTVIELYISNDFMDMSKYEIYNKDLKKKLAEEEAKKIDLGYPVGLKGSLFYMASLGVFKQSSENVAEINFKQNSPVTIGTSFSYYPEGKLYSYSASAYYSYLLASSNTLTTDKIDIPPEIGFTGYMEYRIQKINALVYSGLDYESFSSFNLRGLQNDHRIYVDGIDALYLTVGLSKQFAIFERPWLIKASLSKSLATNYSNNAPESQIQASSHIDEGTYDGYKMMFYMNYKFSSKFYFHSLLKYHNFTGPSDLSSLRIGVGIGYILF